MNNAQESLLIGGLSEFDIAELKDELNKKGLEQSYDISIVKEQDLEPGYYGEPGSIAVTLLIHLGPPAIAAIAAWLAKGRLQETESVTMKVTKPDGTNIKIKVNRNLMKEEALDKGVLAQLSKWLPNVK